MKKSALILVCIVLFSCFAACGDSRQYVELPYLVQVLDQNESILYKNIFYNDMADDYVGKTITKIGTYTRIYDARLEQYRYYVWGYEDSTKCVDWQWEFVPSNPDSLPPIGSLVKLTGTLTRDDAALDKLWFTDTSIETTKAVTPTNVALDMTVMGTTLERVQIWYLQNVPSAFTGKTLRIYGRVASPTSIQHPCYENVWEQAFITEAEVPAIGTVVILTGSWQGSTVQAGKVEPTADY